MILDFLVRCSVIRTEMYLKSVPLRLKCTLKPIAIAATAPKKTPYKFIPRIIPFTSSSSFLPVSCSKDQRIMANRSCSEAKAKARDGDAPPAERQTTPAKEDREGAEQGRSTGASRAVVRRSAACELFEAIYLCLYVLAWRLGELVVVNVQDALEKLRRNALEKFRKKR